MEYQVINKNGEWVSIYPHGRPSKYELEEYKDSGFKLVNVDKSGKKIVVKTL